MKQLAVGAAMAMLFGCADMPTSMTPPGYEEPEPDATVEDCPVLTDEEMLELIKENRYNLDNAWGTCWWRDMA